MTRTLQAEDVISHYRIVGPLGAGGMGEVYLALDETLERHVALKILPPQVFKDEDRVRRFILEAKSASSLNHPNIVTIYEIGQDQVRSKSGAVEAGDGPGEVHFISMELISGETLSAEIHQKKTDLRTLLGYLAQAAEGLAKAHAAGIVHRDLKPGNIMVTKDGYAKVLDFGLAKLTEKRESDAEPRSTQTELKDLTGQGVVMGTVGYMSPEQVRGNVVDHRSDVFSFGCVLYEAATRRRPFVADTNVETLHKILNEKPAPIEEIDPKVPAEVRRLIRRCLAKQVDQRLQSMKDLAIELREIVDEYDTLSASSGSGSSISSAATAATPVKSRAPMIGMATAVIVAVAGIAFGLYGFLHGRSNLPATGASRQSMKTTSLLSEPGVKSAVLSSDGRYLAYTLLREGRSSLRVRQVTTGGDVEILKPQQAGISGLAFSPDGDYFYYLGEDHEHPGYRALLQVPSLGGVARKRGFDVDSSVTFSPDGKRVCFRRGAPQNQEDLLVILDLDTGAEKSLAKVKAPELFLGHPSWSPDGRHIAAALQTNDTKGNNARIVLIDPESGRQETLGEWRLPSMVDVSWLADGTGLVFAGVEGERLTEPQIWFMSYPEGRTRRITNDQSYYDNVSVSKNGPNLVALRRSMTANIWAVSPNGRGQIRPITRRTGAESAIGEFNVADDGTLVFITISGPSSALFKVGADGADGQAISNGTGVFGQPRLVPGSVLYTQAEGGLLPHVWSARLGGENVKRVTEGEGEVLSDASPDGKRILYSSRDFRQVWSMPTDGGAKVKIADDNYSDPRFSPDATLVHYASFRQGGEFAREVNVILPAAGGQPVATLMLPGSAESVSWAPDGKALAFVQEVGGVQNIYRQAIAGGEPTQVTHFKEGRLTAFGWSRDGSRLHVQRELGSVGNLWVTPIGNGEPVQVTDFKTGVIFSTVWGPDGKTLYFTYGDIIQDVVLIRDFR